MSDEATTMRTAMVFSDMDDTFLAHDKRIPVANLEALELLDAAGIPFVPCTGRSVSGVPREIMDHRCCRHAIACNGALVWDIAQGQALRRRSMSRELVLDIFGRIQDLDVSFDVFVGDCALAERSRFERMMEGFGLDAGTLAMLRAIRTPVDASMNEILADTSGMAIDKVTSYWSDSSTRDELRRRLAEFDGIGVTSSHARNYEFMAAGVSKGSAMNWLADSLGIPLARIVAFGDAPNDTSMLELAGDGVAVGNAETSVIASADHLCPSCDDAGPGRYLARLLQDGLKDMGSPPPLEL